MNENRKKAKGRPKGSKGQNSASETLPRVRVTPKQLASYKNAAQNSGKNFSQWVRDILDEVAN